MGNWVAPGIGDVGSYQASGTPFVIASGGAVTKTFKFVTRAITLSAANDGCQISFGDTGPVAFTLAKAGTVRLEVRCTTVTITPNGGNASAVVELTGIPASQLDQHDQADFGS